MKPEEVDKLICGWSMMTGHGFKDDDLNSLVDLIALKSQEAVKAERERCAKLVREWPTDMENNSTTRLKRELAKVLVGDSMLQK
jgi:hypothetical protein